MSHASLVEALDLYYFQKGLSAELSKTAGSLGNEASKCTSPSGVRQQKTPPYYALLLESTTNEGADDERVCGFGNYRCENHGSMPAAGVRPFVAERCEFSCDYFNEVCMAEATA